MHGPHRFKDVPPIDVRLINSGNSNTPYGCGELANPPVAPAIANAVFNATGKRVRRLPIRL